MGEAACYVYLLFNVIPLDGCFETGVTGADASWPADNLDFYQHVLQLPQEGSHKSGTEMVTSG